MKKNERMIIGKFLLIFGLLLQIWRVLVPTCAWAQTYEDAAKNSVIIEELMDADFVYDKDSGLWLIETTDEYSDEQVKYSGEYNLYDNYGRMTVLFYLMDDDTNEYELAAKYDMTFKWFESDKEIGIVTCNIETYRYVGEWLF